MGIFDGIGYGLTGGAVGAVTQGTPSYVVLSGPEQVGGKAIPYYQSLGRATLKSGSQGGTIGATVIQGSPFFRSRSPLAASREFYQSRPGQRLRQSAPGSAKLARDIANFRTPTLPKRRRAGGRGRQMGAGGALMALGAGGTVGTTDPSGLGVALNPTTFLVIGGLVLVALMLGVRRNR